MKKIRSKLLMVATVSVVLMLTLLPAAASAAPGDSPADSYPSGGSTAAVATEFNRAVAGNPPSGLPCAAVIGAAACYQEAGDRWWVLDTRSDGASADAVWQNWRNGDLYRQGICRNSLGSGKWGVCNKNYYEDSFVRWGACVFDGSSNTIIRCSDEWTAFYRA